MMKRILTSKTHGSDEAPALSKANKAISKANKTDKANKGYRSSQTTKRPKKKGRFYRHVLTTLKSKMIAYTFVIIVFMTILSVYSLSITNIYKQKIDEMFVRNLTLKEIDDAILVVDSYLVSYLSTKDSASLNNYMQYEEELREIIGRALDATTGYTEEDLMVRDIHNMTRNYLSMANQAISEKRKSNVVAYNKRYDEADQVKTYIQGYIDELNRRQLDRNANYYLYMTRQVRNSNYLNIVLIMDLVLLSIIIVFKMTSSMVDPIVRLSHSAGEIAKGDFESEEIIVETGDEIEILARAFNKMKHSIHAYIEALKETAYTEAKLKDQQMENLKMQSLLDNARLYALQSQMNPHFLFNTINAAVQLSLMEGADRTSEFLETMSRLFRYNIKQVSESVTLDHEVQNIKDYHELLKVRFGDLIRFEFMVEESALAYLMPPLTLQPLVENAYIHGLAKKEEGGTIRIEIVDSAYYLMITIEDDGIGMSQETIERIYHKKTKADENPTGNGIGMTNVIERLELFYKEKGLLKIASEPFKGTKIELSLPHVKEGDLC